ncbi:MAG: pyruvate ferredoxin oxidoreductase [Crenarchaeota archaeon]|nr:pyruvate ferredoxin oxidoreductase [Thermoproteota archaeon]MCR8453383.1 pyruvate ferredoxin oxidoreductase [Thermoproteota archaeon]MCR8455713.1 pyruvate ferredoxin oxidoreductase [Thermoproteota archaeon]MCR8462550.1 pyruvate ferredoxin oxidoreductase [Thermoproteota archaeon]MCR8470722.1 pyruvate ferredoxin oxidoreductase [Thermoproteota archaeon]
MVEEQVEMLLNGDFAVAWAWKHVEPDVVAAFPITPQTLIVEKFAEFVANGEVRTQFINVESEHSAISAMVGAAAAGARTATATAANGLQLMHEILYIVSSMRLPVMMAVANRAVSGPINIHCDHTDAMGQRDAGWIMLFTEDAQEAYDTTIQAFKISENPDVLLPTMVCLDGFLVSHTAMNLKVFGNPKIVKDFVGEVRPVARIKLMGEEVELSLNPRNKIPLTFGPFCYYDYYFEFKRQQIEAMKAVPEIVERVNKEYYELSGRLYGNGRLVPWNVDDADIVAVVMGSAAGTLRWVARKYRERGTKIGILKVRMFRPFPWEEVQKLLENKEVVAVFDRAQDAGAMVGPLSLEVLSALYYSKNRPKNTVTYIFGLGGRDLTPELAEKTFEELIRIKEGKEKPFIKKYIGVRE